MGASVELNAAEAAARLGVKKATLYAYVSRGLLHRRVALDGRTSLFDSAELDQLRSGRRRVAEGEVGALIATGLTDVRDGSVNVAGRDLPALAMANVGFEAVAELLWSSPEDSTLSLTATSWAAQPDAVAAACRVAEVLGPDAPAIERLRVACAAVSTADPLRSDLSPAAVAIAGRTLIPAMVAALGGTARRVPGPDGAGSASVAEALWPRLTSLEPSRARVRALDGALVLLSDHGMATSTFGARVAASVRADPYAVVAAGLGVVGGALHGAASREVHRLVLAASTAEVGMAIGDALQRTGAFPGYGHSVHRDCDPRARALFDLVHEAWAGDARLEVIAAVRSTVAERTGAVENIDLALGSLTWLAGMDDDAGEAIFAIARTAGWLAHAIEEYDEQPLRFRPRARYTGPRSEMEGWGS